MLRVLQTIVVLISKGNEMYVNFIKKAIVAFFIIYPSLLLAETSFWQQKDKQQHFAATTAISFAVTGYARNQGYSQIESFFWGFGTAVAVGLIKEGIDGQRKNGHQSFKDVQADILGGFTGALISTQFEWKF